MKAPTAFQPKHTLTKKHIEDNIVLVAIQSILPVLPHKKFWNCKFIFFLFSCPSKNQFDSNEFFKHGTSQTYFH